MTDNLIIKRAFINDMDDISYLLKGYRNFYAKEAILQTTIAEFIQQRMQDKEVTIFLACLSGKAVGIAQLYAGYSTLSLGKFLTLHDLFIDENYRGQGIGRKLLEACKSFAINSGAFSLVLKTEHDNVAAQRLYEGFNFTKDDVYCHYKLMLN